MRFLKQGEVGIRVRWGGLTKNKKFDKLQRNAMQIRTNKKTKKQTNKGKKKGKEGRCDL